MGYDICLVTYNSAGWLPRCIEALAAMEYDKGEIGIYVADNASQDDSITVLAGLKEQLGQGFKAFEILPQRENRGFGAGCNAAAAAGDSDYVFFLNVDTKLWPDALRKVDEARAEVSAKTAAFELRQFPYEHPKYYDPATLAVGWASGACMIVRRDVLAEVGGFDESIFMYAEDVDLSWRIRAAGHKIRYVPAAVVWHDSYAEAGEEKPGQVAGSAVGNYVLRLKYGTEEDIEAWRRWYERHLGQLEAVEGAMPLLKAGLKRAKKNRKKYRAFYEQQVQGNSLFTPCFEGLDYEFQRAGAFYENRLPKDQPRFSVLVRTYKRPELLRMTLRSLCWQTYTNFEVIVVEDGQSPVARTVAEEFAGRLELRYHAMERAAGRCAAGNEAMRFAAGEYLCFLDDDDYFYPEHLEVMACLIEDEPGCRLLAAGAVEAACVLLNGRGTRWHVEEKKNISQRRISYATLCQHNPFPIQAAVFHKSLVEEAGGLDVELDAFEDWDLWMRFGLLTEVACVEKATSLYKMPAGEKAFAERDRAMAGYRRRLYEKAAGYTRAVTAQDIMALAYTPELADEWKKAGHSGVDYLAYKKGLAATTREIAASRAWKLGAPLRLLPAMVAGLCGAVAGGTGGLARRAAHWRDRVGPKVPDIEKGDPAELNDFIFKSRRSASWRFAQWLARGGKG